MYNPLQMRKGWLFSVFVASLLAVTESGSLAAVEEAVIPPLEPVPLTFRSFREFGQVVETSDTAKPTSESAIHKYWAGVAKTRIHENIDFGLTGQAP